MAVSPADRVLVIDDERSVAESIAGAFARYPERFEARALHDASRAAEQIRDWRPALVVVDALMPAVDGLDLCAWVRDNPERGIRKARIIAITGKKLTEFQKSFLAKHVDAYFSKPFDVDELVEGAAALLGLPLP